MKTETARLLRGLRSVKLETVWDWLNRAIENDPEEPGRLLSFERYLNEIKEVSEATERMKDIDERIRKMPFEEQERRQARIDYEREKFISALKSKG